MRALDEQGRVDHPYLCASDRCWALSEYLAGTGRRGGSINRMIVALKQSPSDAALDPIRRRRKQRAIQAAADLLRSQVCRKRAESMTWIPIPPSRATVDRNFDNRLLQVLRVAFDDYDADIRSVLSQVVSTASDHLSVRRCGVEELYRGLRVNREALYSRPLRSSLVLFDDVLTTGKHFRCCERRLHEWLPDARIDGLFIARRALSGRGRRLPRVAL
jgi:predicted amidophosphoribosyltransferase